MADEDAGNCPKCNRPLTGAVEVVKTQTSRTPIIQLRETPDRNWIQCDACNLVVCKSCCLNAASGFCNDCWQKLQNADLCQTSGSEICAVIETPKRNKFKTKNTNNN